MPLTRDPAVRAQVLGALVKAAILVANGFAILHEGLSFALRNLCRRARANMNS